uniref:Uncharacterized protein n=1 Tax=Cucumis melo TaxID=3656 RepID=A0A9I9EJ82_CUCME
MEMCLVLLMLLDLNLKQLPLATDSFKAVMCLILTMMCIRLVAHVFLTLLTRMNLLKASMWIVS